MRKCGQKFLQVITAVQSSDDYYEHSNLQWRHLNKAPNLHSVNRN